jgi:hypothetical protein
VGLNSGAEKEEAHTHSPVSLARRMQPGRQLNATDKTARKARAAVKQVGEDAPTQIALGDVVRKQSHAIRVQQTAGLGLQLSGVEDWRVIGLEGWDKDAAIGAEVRRRSYLVWSIFSAGRAACTGKGGFVFGVFTD